MRAKLRTWLGSWQVWVIVACLAYIVGIRGRGPFIVAIWPKGLWVAYGLWMGAILVLIWFLLKYLVVPFLMFLQGEKKGGRTAKAKEKLADSFMSFSTAVASALVISLLVVPFTTFIQAMTRGVDPVAALVSWWPPAWWSDGHTAVFLILFWLPMSVSLLFRRRALDIYDEMARTPASSAASAVDPTAKDAHESPSAPARLQTTPASPNGGSRRRRHRAR